MNKTKVFIVDDSAVIRMLLQKILNSDPEIEVVGTAPDPFTARDKLVSLRPDVMILDIEMPRMDGMTFLEKVMEHFPIRTIIFSSLSLENSSVALKCLEIGAIETLAKPAIDVTKGVNGFGDELIEKVKMVAKAKLPGTKKRVPRNNSAVEKSGGGALPRTTHQLIAIASSTGGTEALKVLLSGLPADIPGTVVVQHMPAVFTKSYAEHLNEIFPFTVKEAEEGDRVLPGQVLIAPGDYHMEVARSGGYYYVKLNQGPAQHWVRPAADVLMKSVAHCAGSNAIGVVLTGMGKDGGLGLLEMKKAGSYNIAQNEETCVIYGMPKYAVDCGAIDKVLPLESMAKEIMRFAELKKTA